MRVLIALALSTCLWGSATTAWEMNTYQDFIRGRFQGVSLNRDGRLTLAPKMETVFSSDQPIVWSIAQAPDGSLYAGTGHRGRLFRVDRSGSSSLLWTAEQPEIFSVAVDPKGVLYAATSPDGKVYRFDNGKPVEYFAPQTKYIWSMAFAPDGTLYVGTGDQGKVFRVQAEGKGEVYYATGQSHVTALTVDREGRVLAGTEPNGLLYRISGKDKAFVLYDANLPEIRAISTAADGTVYAVAMGGSVARRAAGALQGVQNTAGGAVITTTSASITVDAAAAQSGAEIKPPAEPAKPAQQPAPAAQVPPPFVPVVDLTGVEKSAVYRINPDNTVETLWSSKDENVYDLVAIGGQLLFSTDGNGRIYRLSRDRKLTLVAQTNDAEATRLLPGNGGVLAATGNMGRIYRLGEQPGLKGSYESPVHDAGSTAQWGRLSWRAETSRDGALAFRTRSGNSARPDQTWSDWSEPLHESGGSRITNPNARYIQWKAEFTNSGVAALALDSVSVAYLPQNSPPVVKTISIVTQPVNTGSKAAAQQTAAVYSVTVTDTGDSGSPISSGTPTQTLSRASAQQINVTWQADDPDGDRLVYNLYFRGEGEREWKPLKLNIHETSVSVDGDALADGKYFFRVTASDREANPPAAARDAELISAPVLIDNTPPAIVIGSQRTVDGKIVVEFEAVDAASPLRRCEYSIDAQNWTPIQAADGIIDSPREKFILQLDRMPPGEHVLVIRAVDSANNAGLAKLIIR